MSVPKRRGKGFCLSKTQNCVNELVRSVIRLEILVHAYEEKEGLEGASILIHRRSPSV